MSTRHAALQLGRGALRHDPALVEHCDPIGELVRLVEILGGEQDGHPGRGELADDLPHGEAAAWVQAGGGLVQEDDPGLTDEGHGEIESPSHPARVGRQQLVGGVGEVELLQQFSDPPSSSLAAEVAKIGHQAQILGPGEQVVHGRELSGDPDVRPHPVRVGGHVVTGDLHDARIGRNQGRKNADHCGLAGPVRAQQREDRALVRGQVHLVEYEMAAERLAHVVGHDPRRADACHRAAPSPSGPGTSKRFVGGPQRLPALLPLLLQQGKALHQEIGERCPLHQDRSPFGWGVGQHAQPFPGQIALLPVLGHVEARGMRRRHVDAHPVHPLASGPGSPDQSERFQRVDRAGDGAPAGEEGVSQLGDALLPRIADRQVSQEAAHHGGHPVAAGIEPAGVVGKGDLLVTWHVSPYYITS